MQEEGKKSPLNCQMKAMPRDYRVETTGSSSGSNTRTKSEVSETTASPRTLPHTLSKPEDFSTISPSPANLPKRAGTLSWQQRPSRGFTGARGSSRPLSMANSDKNAAETPQAVFGPVSTGESPLSKYQIAQSLGSKDPGWFKQTEDRGMGSAAYWRNKEDETSELVSSNGPMRLPGLSRESSLEPEKPSNPPEITRSTSPSNVGSGRIVAGRLHRYSSSASTSSKGGVRSPLPTLSSQRFQPPLSDASSSLGEESSSITRTLAMSPSQGRISPERLERPQSPTKGLGGFVQSAMLKRSDSVNKRWSAQAAPGLSRGNSIASNRSGYDTSRQPFGGINPSTEFKPVSPNRDSSPLANSRPGSSHSTVTVTQARGENDRPITEVLPVSGQPKSSFDIGFAKPALPHLKRSQSMTESHENVQEDMADNPTPASPAKKWSPTKASWLENAINKPDSPKPRVFPPQQPSWMMDMNKAKQQREYTDSGKSEAVKDATLGDLFRSPTLGSPTKPRSIDRFPLEFNAGLATKSGDETLDNAAADNSMEPKPLPEQNDAVHLSTPSESSGTGEKPPFKKEAGSSNPQLPPPSTSSTESVQAMTRLGSPSPLKPKPQTPPKIDFRSGLKPRPTTDGKGAKEEAEFKNVFGKLKRTQTQNYVAPDELKDNILRGKAGLAMTGGPQKTERRDELKESILKQKEAMKGASPTVPRKPRGISPLGNKDPPTPEAITKRMGLTKSESGLSSTSSPSREDGRKARAVRPGGFVELNPVGIKPKPDVPDKEPNPFASIRKEPSAKGRDPFSSSLAGLLSRGPSPTASSAKPTPSMNPSVLAGDAPKINSEEEIVGGPQLTHMTKSRARGPKRRLPVTVKDSPTVEAPSTILSPVIKLNQIASSKPSVSEKPQALPTSRSETGPLTNISNNNRKTSQPLTSRKPSTHVVLPEEKKPLELKSSNEEPLSAPKKPSPVIDIRPNQTLNPERVKKPLNSTMAPPTEDAKKSLGVGEFLEASSTIEQQSKEQDNDTPLTSVKDAAAIWGKASALESSQPSKTKSPVKLPTRKDKEKALERAVLTPVKSSTPIGLGIRTTREDSTKSAPLDRNLPSPPILLPKSPNSPKSPPLPGKKPTSIASRIPSSTLASEPIEQERSYPQSTYSSRLLAGFFGEVPSSSPKLNTDIQSFLASRSVSDESEKIKTLRKQIYQVTGGGKLLPVPSHQEHILFEENLYICTHVFGTLAGTRTTEVYLWYGEGVAQSAAEDAQLFARKVAKENNGKLIVLQQGKETSNFFQALGGIVITRRGSGGRGGSPSRTSATYMLCGRRHVGQIAFDEVDFSGTSLCSGFPYIISARFGKLYLWKGSGSGADELGCARLIGMDLGLTGEIEEVEEGHEPDAFWESIPGGKLEDESRTARSRHWHLKPSCEKYKTRLFSIDVEPSRPKSSSSTFKWVRRGSAPQDENTGLNTQISEIAPFTKRDLVKEGTYVLDSFFEIFMYVCLSFLPAYLLKNLSNSTLTSPYPYLVSFQFQYHHRSSLHFPSIPKKLTKPLPTRIIPTSRPSSRPPLSPSSTTHASTPLCASLLFVQEYAILSASLDDRPFIPHCNVVFTPALPGDEYADTVPELVRWAFRKWDYAAVERCSVLGSGEVGKAVGM